MEELITIVINVYNREKFIKKCLDSVINQTYKNIEILIVNDGSTDNTLKICESYKDERIRIITTENKGLSLSRNVGIENSKGEYLYFVDSDDFIESDTIEYLYNLCKKYNAKFSSCVPLSIFDYNFKVKNKKEEIKLLTSYEMLKKVLIFEEMSGTLWNKLLKKELFNEIRFEDRITDDIVVVYKLVLEAEKIVYSNQIKYYFLKHSNSVTTNGYEDYDRSVDFYKATIERYENIKKIYPNFIENDVGVIKHIVKLYMLENKEIEKFLIDQKAIQLFRKLFSFRILKCKLARKEKIKIILFALNPNICKFINKKYQSNREIYKI